MPSLYIVSTPIGNLEDITLRAIRVLNDVDIIAAEDTRVTRKLLSHYKIHTRVTSYNEHNKSLKIPRLVDSLSKMDIALVSDAGTPTINDPGVELVRAVIRQGFEVVPVPGPSAVTTALSVSAFSGKQFLSLGFLPNKKSERKTFLKTIENTEYTTVFFEAPHRLKQTLKELSGVIGNRNITVLREATKYFEEIFYGTVASCELHFDKPKGEFTVVIEGSTQKEHISDHDIVLMLTELLKEGVSMKDARETLAQEMNVSKRDLYRLSLSMK
ncbi:MAG: 16S rRNA (cytidine(1402)-2'-O)-methyltransferase [SAR202 cluster bacterium]|nr:16S rRNA (cytidine(1402)-2'-O)-methyltransferase [SAR202 cluster bacterium]|tara:strand:+ start:4247 stop:5059 length:813 start_codon:yes stop_codon:yes gene_type:complete